MEQQLRKDSTTKEGDIILSDDEQENKNECVVGRNEDSPAGEDTANSGRKVVVGGKESSPVQGGEDDGGAGKAGEGGTEKSEDDGAAGKAGVDGVPKNDEGDAAGTTTVEKCSTAGQSSASTSPIYMAKSNNKKRACPLCDFFGVHLRHRLASVHPDDAESAAE